MKKIKNTKMAKKKPGENHKFNEGSDTTVSHDIDKQDNDSSISN